jgi:hypothetical protein
MSRRPRAAVVVVSVLAALQTMSRVAHASPTVRLVYVRDVGAESCPDETTLKQSVMAHLGYDPFRPFAGTTLFAEVGRASDRFVGHVKILDDAGIERGARTLEDRGSDCSDIAAAMALSMSIAIDPRSALKAAAPPSPPVEIAPVEPAPEPPPSSPPVPVVLPRETKPPPSVPMPRSLRRIGLGLGIYGSVGETGGATLGVRGSGEFVATTWSAGLELRGDLPTRLPIQGGGGVETSLLGGAVVPCARRALAWATLAVCGVGFVGRMDARTVDVPHPASRPFVHLAAGARLGVDVPFTDALSIRVALDAMGTLAPFVFMADGKRVYESPVVSGLGGASLVFAF